MTWDVIFRRMRLKTYFHNPLDKGNNTQINLEDTISLIPQNSFDPNINDPFLDAFFVFVKEEIENHTIRIPNVKKLTNEERNALHSLQSNTNLLIKS